MNSLNLKYNYIICGAGDYYAYGYRDLFNVDYARYFEEQDDGFEMYLGRKIVRLCFSRQINKFIKTPFSNYVFPRLFYHGFDEKKPLCYIFFYRHRVIFESSYLDFLRKQHPNIKFVLFLQDIVEKYEDFDLIKLRSIFDLILSYDKGDSEKYGFVYNTTPMSVVDVPLDDSLPESDIFFCGYAKPRYPLIFDIYNKCMSLGLRCDFNIMLMPEGSQRVEGINYPPRRFTYQENIQHILKTKCILEIMQEGAKGFTPRLWESIVYNKHLLTNNSEETNSEFYYKPGNHDIKCLEDGNFNKIIRDEISYPAELKKKLSPINLLQCIDKLL